MADCHDPFPVLDLAPRRGLGRVRAAFADLGEAFSLMRLTLALSWLDIKMRYRGSILGPLWLTLSMAVMVGALGLIYGRLFHMDVTHYLPFLSLSLMLWGYIAAVVGEASTVFVQHASLFHAMRVPICLPVIRIVIRNLLIVAHNSIVVAVVFAVFHVWPKVTWGLLFSLPLWLADSFAAALLIGIVGARFRDVPPIVASLMQVFFFVTPVIWQPALIYVGRQYLLLDPFYPVLEVLRAPLLGEAVRPVLWAAALGQGVLLWGAVAFAFTRFRARVPYWI